MKFSFLACLLLCSSMAFAQLTVTNNSYIFVDGDGFTAAPDVAPLYVTNEVNLTDADSKIYLRNEAQLIQDFTTTTSTNSGTGQLSVYQTGTVNQWSYNYWCSPIGNNSAASGNENARVNLIDDATGLISSTDAAFTTGFDGSASPLTISDRWLWTYQTADQYIDWVYVGATGNISPGLGFTMKGNGTGLTGSQVYDFRGKPNNGTITNDVANGLNTLVGNPYPSAMDSALFIHDPQNQASITGTLLFWEQEGNVPSHTLQDYRGGYYSFTINSAGTVITDTPAQFMTYDEDDNTFPLAIPTNGSKSAGRYIPIGQGFMVEGVTGTPATPATVYAKNAHRVFAKESDGNSYFFRNSTDNGDNTTETVGVQYQDNGLSIVPDDFKRFRINVDFTANEAQYTRQLVLNFHESATAGFDYGLELIHSEPTPSDAYFSLDEKIYNGQAFPFAEELIIPISIDIEEQQPLRFRIFDIQNFDESQGIYIHDLENDTYVNLRNLDYELNIEPGNYSNRFEIVFTPEGTLDINEFDVTSLSIRQDNNNQELTVLNPTNLDVKTIELYDVSGRRVLSLPIDNVLDHYNLSTVSISDGAYIVKVATKSSTNLKSQKILVKH
ncbi:T9SS type A sorting domain-containing protein [Winogradskyella sp. Asnod2-B02-A]|uniref:T9SS type A sorting domain-containing protein n=1 Tax=Winogradskyella sp. Asnod2-B02-A TaxID=3160583 RepID=UPI00386DBE0A